MNVRKKETVFIGLFLLPAIAVYTLFMIVPLGFSIFYGLTEWNGVKTPEFIGLANFVELFKDADYWLTMENTFVLILLGIFFKIPVALVLAFMVARIRRGFKIFRTVFFLPMVIAPIAIGLMFTLIYNSEIGLLNKLLDVMGLSFLQMNWLSNVDIVLYSVSVPQVWQAIGLFFIIFLGSIMSIPEEMIESAQMDGASPFRVLKSIVVPQLWDVIQICIILAVTGAFKQFELPWVITQGGPGLASAYTTVFMFKEAFISYNFGYGSAISITLTVYSLIFTVVLKRFFTRDGTV